MYRVYVREPDEPRGHRLLDTDSLAEARQELEGMEFPEDSFVYIKYTSPGYYGGRRPDKPIEAYKVEGGGLVRIFSRYKGGEWPSSWRLTLEERGGERSYHTPGYEKKVPREERERIRKLLESLGVERRGEEWKGAFKELSRGLEE